MFYDEFTYYSWNRCALQLASVYFVFSLNGSDHFRRLPGWSVGLNLLNVIVVVIVTDVIYSMFIDEFTYYSWNRCSLLAFIVFTIKLLRRYSTTGKVNGGGRFAQLNIDETLFHGSIVFFSANLHIILEISVLCNLRPRVFFIKRIRSFSTTTARVTGGTEFAQRNSGGNC